jgi:transcriptional regulator with GAF, ATPase, and Fis domain
VLFLDEIGDMPLATQARLLRVLQARSIQPLGSGEPVALDIRVVSASNRDLAAEVRAGRFRQDLYYRIAGLTLVLPALRERSDRRALIEEVHGRYREPGQPARLPDDVLTVLERHPWPGNLRELVSVMQVALALAGEQPVGVEHLPDSFLAEAGKSAVHEHAPNDLGELLRAPMAISLPWPAHWGSAARPCTSGYAPVGWHSLMNDTPSRGKPAPTAGRACAGCRRRAIKQIPLPNPPFQLNPPPTPRASAGISP